MRRWLLLSGLTAAFFASFPTHSQSLHDALEGAWSRQPAGRAAGARGDELAAKRDAAAAFFPEPPSVSLGYRTDGANQNAGIREFEGVISLPVWSFRRAPRRSRPSPSPGSRRSTRGPK